MSAIASARATSRADELIGDRLVDEHPRRRRALLATEPERAASRALDGQVEIGRGATITGFLPPISQIAGFGCDVEKDWMIDMPIALDPVNVSPSTPG